MTTANTLPLMQVVLVDGERCSPASVQARFDSPFSGWWDPQTKKGFAKSQNRFLDIV